VSGLSIEAVGQDFSPAALAQEEGEGLMDWFRCPTCIYNHPFQVTDERPCPNLNLTAEQGMAVFRKDNVLYEPLGPHKKGET
jgi:hypothetical protein